MRATSLNIAVLAMGVPSFLNFALCRTQKGQFSFDTYYRNKIFGPDQAGLLVSFNQHFPLRFKDQSILDDNTE